MKIWLSLGILAASTVPAYAIIAVPEIDALSGLSAMALVGSLAAVIWERRRRNK